MAKRAKKAAAPAAEATTTKVKPGRVDLGELLSDEEPTQDFKLWLLGTTPLICHAWSEKAKQDMLKGQVGSTRTAKEKRDPEADFLASLYDMGDGKTYGFPVTAVKKAILACAHKDRGIPRTDVMAALWLDAEVVRVRPALASAICDLPLVRIYAGPPAMREDMVRIGAGLRKTANLAYRAQFSVWGMRITGSVNPLMVAPHALAFLTKQAGSAIGIGDWRNEKGGWFGAFRIATPQEAAEWEKFAAGKGPLPKVKQRGAPPPQMMEAAE
jgi:hypothetical protein